MTHASTPHGTYYAYCGHRCRCGPCKDAARTYWRERSRMVRGKRVDEKAFADLLHELFPDGLTTAAERAEHEGVLA